MNYDNVSSEPEVYHLQTTDATHGREASTDVSPVSSVSERYSSPSETLQRAHLLIGGAIEASRCAADCDH